ncbi:hypothetical protein [Methanosphaerula palustris]|uniref:Uncharacterized protein n=1 Tax=Methanosphaerula palustris (strain ATCC BAA-1556 / DSM 19958 / E1-9c) TaxID=521011 RepID=B8GF97_METPE|nr:hypothetical protein [Methanosphaerula palustris]ACL17903.1 hypothetical protein Mpal_2635 [Methanosphaerula palustris E1-9c]
MILLKVALASETVEEEFRALDFGTLATRNVVGDLESGVMIGAARTILLI